MNNNINRLQFVAIFFCFIMIGFLSSAGTTIFHHDVWLGLVIAIILNLPVILMMARTFNIYQGKSFFDIIKITFGRHLFYLITLIFIFTIIIFGTINIRLFTEFIQIVALRETPQFIIALFIGLLAVFATRRGPQVIGRIAKLIFYIIILFIILVTLESISSFDINNLKPVAVTTPIKDFTKGTLYFLSHPFAELIFLMPFVSYIKKSKSKFSPLIIGYLVSAIFLIINELRTVLLLGPFAYSSLYFPEYYAITIIKGNNLFQRVEAIYLILFTILIFFKIAILVKSASLAINSITKSKSVKLPSFTIAVLIVLLGTLMYKNLDNLIDFSVNIVNIFPLFISILLPLIIWIVAEIKNYRNKRLEN